MDDLPKWTEMGGHGTVTGISNLAPAATVKLFNLCQQKNLSGKEAQQAKEILETLTRADDVLMPLGVRGQSKYLSGRLEERSADF